MTRTLLKRLVSTKTPQNSSKFTKFESGKTKTILKKVFITWPIKTIEYGAIGTVVLTGTAAFSYILANVIILYIYLLDTCPPPDLLATRILFKKPTQNTEEYAPKADTIIRYQIDFKEKQRKDAP